MTANPDGEEEPGVGVLILILILILILTSIVIGLFPRRA